MNATETKQSSASPTLVQPATWTMARLAAGRRDDLGGRMAEVEARSRALTNEIVTLVADGADPSSHTEQLWHALDALDALQRLRIEQ